MYRLSESQTKKLGGLRQLADAHIAVHADQVDRTAQFPQASMAALAEAGWLGLSLPTESGGQGEGMRLACAVLDELGQRCASTAMIYLMHLCGCACYVAQPGPAAEALKQVAAGKHLTTLAWSEKGSRSHFWAPMSQAVQRNGQVEISAQKSFVTSAQEADGFVVSTRSPGGTDPTDTMLYLVLKGDAGFTSDKAWDGLGMRGNGSSAMTFDRCQFPSERALCAASQGFPTMLGVVLPWFNLGSAAVCVGLAEAATQTTVRHLTSSRLENVGSALSDLPTLRARVAKMRIETDRARAHLVAALHAVESGAANATLMVLESKAAAADSAMLVTDLGMQACGGAAFGRQLGLERIFRDARASSVMAPTSDVLAEFIGRAICGMELF